jgi:cytochrome c biogenesis protein CcmG/thiol:disulfide interchange protein DsbE
MITARHRGVIVFSILFGLIFVYSAVVFFQKKTPLNYAEKIEVYAEKGVPNFQLPLFKTGNQSVGQFVDFDGSKDEITIINFWATWCEPCVREFPSLQRLSEKYQNDPRLRIVAVSIDRDPTQITQFLAQRGELRSNFQLAIDLEGRTANSFGTKKIPETYIVSKGRKLLRKVISEQNWVSPEFLELLDGFLKNVPRG